MKKVISILGAFALATTLAPAYAEPFKCPEDSDVSNVATMKEALDLLMPFVAMVEDTPSIKMKMAGIAFDAQNKSTISGLDDLKTFAADPVRGGVAQRVYINMIARSDLDKERGDASIVMIFDKASGQTCRVEPEVYATAEKARSLSELTVKP